VKTNQKQLSPYCRNCGYLTAIDVTVSYSCRMCSRTVEWHSNRQDRRFNDYPPSRVARAWKRFRHSYAYNLAVAVLFIGLIYLGFILEIL
jgi:hypothetical protein